GCESTRWTDPRDYDHVYGSDREARGRRAGCAWSRGARRLRRPHHKAPRQGVAARTGFWPHDGVCGVLESLAYRALRWTGVERPAVVDGRGACDRPRAHDVRESLG